LSAVPIFVKICGITSPHDAEIAIAADADAIGINFVPGSPRRVDVARARRIAEAVGGRIEIAAVVADLPDDEIAAIVETVGVDSVQAHGAESPDDTKRIAERVGKPVIKAVRLATPADVDAALRYREFLLVDASVAGALGGTGQQANWGLAAELVRRHGNTLLAGGLTPENVAEAIARVAPFGVDTASGVESAPGIKDAEKVRQFVTNARSAATL
jgi:phosphoribosylanthranilate isomerase